jgi:hypothetical protein
MADRWYDNPTSISPLQLYRTRTGESCTRARKLHLHISRSPDLQCSSAAVKSASMAPVLHSYPRTIRGDKSRDRLSSDCSCPPRPPPPPSARAPSRSAHVCTRMSAIPTLKPSKCAMKRQTAGRDSQNSCSARPSRYRDAIRWLII